MNKKAHDYKHHKIWRKEVSAIEFLYNTQTKGEIWFHLSSHLYEPLSLFSAPVYYFLEFYGCVVQWFITIWRGGIAQLVAISLKIVD
jgi:hypothetical protein